MSNLYVIYRADVGFVICREDVDVHVIAIRNTGLWHVIVCSKCDAVGSLPAYS